MKALLLALFFCSFVVAADPIPDLSEVPLVYQGYIHGRLANVHVGKKNWYIVYIEKTPWGILVLEVVKVNKETFEETQVFVHEKIKV